MTEERHSLSAPRLIPNTDPVSWEVDIFRQGVTEKPIATILINDKTLPPRTRRNKIVWRLPTDSTKVPSFGVDEKRRIMEIFKEQKKNRKKMLKKNSQSTTSNASNAMNGNHSISSIKSDHDETKELCDSVGELSLEIGNGSSNNHAPRDQAVESTEKSPPTKHNRFQPNNQDSPDPSHNINNSQTSDQTPDSPSAIPPPPGFNSSNSSLPPPPEFNYFTLPKTSQSPSSSVPITIAKSFISIYYPFLRAALTSNLITFYHFTAQKSISIGKAHSVVADRINILYQLQQFHESTFDVVGVVAQESRQDGVHLLITGNVEHVGRRYAFAHSVLLVMEQQKQGFCILNDALALLNDGGE